MSAAAHEAAATPSPGLGSTFIQAKAAAGWGDERWSTGFDEMRDAQIDAVILNLSLDAATVPTNEDVSVMTSFYPTDMPGYTQAADERGDDVDVVGRVLSEAHARGMQVWLGLQLDAPNWYGNDKHGIASKKSDPEWMREQAALSETVATELLSKYAQYDDTIEGWFFPGEDSPWSIDYDNGNVMHDFYVDLSTRLDAVDPSKQILLSPYFHPGGGKSSDDFAAYLERALADTSVDVVATQTCAELMCAPQSDRTDLAARAATISEWLGAARRGIDASGSGATMWANVELFGPAGFSAISDVIDTMRAAAPYVSDFTSWSYTNHWSSKATWGASWWADAYQSYITTGSTPTETPDPPTDVQSTLTDGELTVTWTTPPGQQIAHLELIEVTSTGIAIVALPWQDRSEVTVTHHPAADYLLRTRTAAGTRSAPVTVTTDDASESQNWALDRPYTTDTSAAATYPDSNSTELTDSIRGIIFSDTAWQGRQTSTTAVTIDLTDPIDPSQTLTRPIQNVTLGFLHFPRYGIRIPNEILIEISYDGTHWIPYGAASPSIPTLEGPTEVTVTGLANTKWVRATTTATSTDWTFIDELIVGY